LWRGTRLGDGAGAVTWRKAGLRGFPSNGVFSFAGLLGEVLNFEGDSRILDSKPAVFDVRKVLVDGEISEGNTGGG